MGNNNNNNHNYDSSTSSGFDGYEETTLDPGPWLLLITVVFCFCMMLCVVPLAVHMTVRHRRRLQRHLEILTKDDKECPSPVVAVAAAAAAASVLTAANGTSSSSEPQSTISPPLKPSVTSKLAQVLYKLQEGSKPDNNSNNNDQSATSSLSSGVSGTGGTLEKTPHNTHQAKPITTTTPPPPTTTATSTTTKKITLASIWSYDKESKKILQLAIPHSISAVAKSSLSNLCLICISQNVGTKPVAAYALTQVLVGLTDGILQGPIYACTTVCSQAIGAGNTTLAGSYIQLSLILYGICYIPVVYFWWYYLYEIVLYLEWGDDVTALLAQDFIRVYVFAYILGGLSLSVWQLLEITNHPIVGTAISIAWGATNVAAIAFLTTTNPNATLTMVAHIYNFTSVVFITGTILLAHYSGWLKPFYRGLLVEVSFFNPTAVQILLKQAIPLSMGSLLSNAEWAVLTFFASHLGPAEVAAWALLGSLWEVFYSSTAGIGDAAEIRLAYHLGNNNAIEAQRSAYKALSLGMLVATVISILYFSLQRKIPAWFTPDETLQAMLTELVPFVGVANLTMTFGMQCWSLIGAQGKYKLATWISFISSWIVVMPLAAIFVFVIGLDLQGLTAASCVGYLSTGSALSYVLLSTDWPKVARKIHLQNCDHDTVVDSDDDEDDSFGGGNEDVQLYAALRHKSDAAKRTARGNIRLLMIPAGRRSGIVFGNARRRQGTFVVTVRPWSPLKYSVFPGDTVLALDGVDVSQEDAKLISKRLKSASKYDRFLSFLSSPNNDTDDLDDVVVPLSKYQNLAEDDSSDAPYIGKLSVAMMSHNLLG